VPLLGQRQCRDIACDQDAPATDNDDPGRKHGDLVATKLSGVAKKVRVFGMAALWSGWTNKLGDVHAAMASSSRRTPTTRSVCSPRADAATRNLILILEQIRKRPRGGSASKTSATRCSRARRGMQVACAHGWSGLV
jgi:hypothetical protein